MMNKLNISILVEQLEALKEQCTNTKLIDCNNQQCNYRGVCYEIRFARPKQYDFSVDTLENCSEICDLVAKNMR